MRPVNASETPTRDDTHRSLTVVQAHSAMGAANRTESLTFWWISACQHARVPTLLPSKVNYSDSRRMQLFASGPSFPSRQRAARAGWRFGQRPLGPQSSPMHRPLSAGRPTVPLRFSCSAFGDSHEPRPDCADRIGAGSSRGATHLGAQSKLGLRAHRRCRSDRGGAGRAAAAVASSPLCEFSTSYWVSGICQKRASRLLARRSGPDRKSQFG